MRMEIDELSEWSEALANNRKRNLDMEAQRKQPPVFNAGRLLFEDDAVQLDNSAVFGTLRCLSVDHKGVSWCVHQERAIKSHADSHLIWDVDIELNNIEIQVPMVPTHDQWGTVRLLGTAKTSSLGGAMRVFYRPETVSADTPTTDLIFLGFLHPQEGRQVLRTMLHDFLQAHVAAMEPIKCNNKKHSFTAQMQWERNTDSDRTAIAEHWSVMDTGKCLTCNSFGDEDFSDVVPDGGGKKWS